MDSAGSWRIDDLYVECVEPALLAGTQCAGEDLNLHGPTGHKALNLARLPIPPPARGGHCSQPLTPSDDAATLEHMFASGGDALLTKRQQEIWEFLVQYVDSHGYPPTVREI